MRYDYSNLITGKSALRVDVHAIENPEIQWQQYLTSHLAMSFSFVVDVAITPESVGLETQQMEEAALEESQEEFPDGPIQMFVVEPTQAVPNYAAIVHQLNTDPGNTLVVLLPQQAGQISTDVESAQYSHIMKSFEEAHGHVYHSIEDAVSYLNGLLY